MRFTIVRLTLAGTSLTRIQKGNRLCEANKDGDAAERLLEALGQPVKNAKPQALSNAMGPKGSIARHLPQLGCHFLQLGTATAKKPEKMPRLVMLPEEGKKEDVRTSSMGQVAFISELRAGREFFMFYFSIFFFKCVFF